MKRLNLILLFILLAMALNAAWLSNVPTTKTQPDGSKIELLTTGDEFYQRYHDADNYTIVQNPQTGYFCYAEQDGEKVRATSLIAGVNDAQKRSLSPGVKISSRLYQERRNTMFVLDATKNGRTSPHTGNSTNLVIFIKFLGQTDFGQNMSAYEGWFNTNTNSMKNYFYEASFNQLTVDSYFYPPAQNNMVMAWQSPDSLSYFRPNWDGENPNGYEPDGPEGGQREHQLIADACAGLVSFIPTGLNLDYNNDGYIDNVVFVFMNQGETDGILWPHRAVCDNNEVFIHGKRVWDYNAQNRTMLFGDVGVLAHEYFHSLGAPDLYRGDDNTIAPVGQWDVMAHQTNPPQHMSMYMKWRIAGWIPNIPVLNADGNYTLNPSTSNTNSVYRIDSPYSANEFFIVEYRRKTGTFENSIANTGLLVWRINTTVWGNTGGPPDNIYVYRLNGNLTNDGDRTNAPFSQELGRTVINDTTNPNCFLSNNGLGGLSLLNIGSAGATISFTKNTSAMTTISLPYAQNFDGATFPPDLWLRAKTGLLDFDCVTSSLYPSANPQSGVKMVRYASNICAEGDYATLISPRFYSFGNTNNLYVLSFWMYRDDGLPANDDRLQVYVGNNVSIDSNSQKLLEIRRSINFSPRVAATGWYQYTTSFVLPETGYHNIIFRGISDAGFNMYIDNFYLEKIPYPSTRCEWIGTVSNDMSDPDNWLNGILPASGKDIIIKDTYIYLPTMTSNIVCRSLTTAKDTNMFVRGATLTVEQDAYLNGDIRLLDTAPKLVVYGKLTFDHYSQLFSEGSSPEITVYGDLIIDTSIATDFLMAEGLLKLTGSSSSTMFMDCEVTLQNFTIQKFGAAVTLVNSTWDVLIEGDLVVANGGGFVTSAGDYSIECNGYVNAYGNFQMAGGTLEFSGVSQGITLTENSYLNNLTLSGLTGLATGSNIRVNGNLNIGIGHLYMLANTLYLKGNYIASSTSSFIDTNSTVIFNGTTDQTCSSVNFTNLVLNKSSGKLIIPTGSAVTADSYDYTAGTIEVSGGSLTLNDLVDINIKGSYILSSGSVTLTQDSAQNVDLDANLTISGGTFTINGGTYASDWAYTRTISINISGGTLVFNNASGVNLSNTGYTLTFNGTGGTIKCIGSFLINRSNFTMPGTGTGCTVEMTGSADTNVFTVSTSSIRNLKINKTGRGDSERDYRSLPESRDGETRNVTLTLSGNVNVTGDLTITAGYLDLSNYTLTVGNDFHQYAYLYMYGTAVLNVNNDVYLHSTAAGFLNAGTINVKRNWTNESGVTVQMGSPHTVNFIGTVASTLSLASSNMWFGSVVINKTSGNVILANGVQYFNIANDLTVNLLNSLFLKNSTVMITDLFMINGYAKLEENCGVTAANLNFAGDLEMLNGTVTVTGNYTHQASGRITLNPGNLYLNSPYNGSVYSFAGLTYLNGGLIQIAENTFQCPSGADFDFQSGSLKLGGNFIATVANVFQPTANIVEFIGARNASIQMGTGNYFYNLRINKTAGSTVYLATDATVNNDLTMVSGNFNLSYQDGSSIWHDYIISVGRDVNLNGGTLKVEREANIISVGRNWNTNSVSTAFLEGTGTVNFVSDQVASTNTETFYNVNIMKTSAEEFDFSVRASTTMTVNGELYINPTSGLKLVNNSVLDCNGYVGFDGKLDITSSDVSNTLKLAGNFFDESDEAVNFTANTGCTIIFEGSADQTFGGGYFTGTVLPLCNVSVNKASGRVLPYNNINFLGNFTLTDGEWYYSTAGRTKNFYGDLIIESQGVFSDNSAPSYLLGTADSNLKLLGTADFGTLYISKAAASNNVNLTGNAIFSGTTVIRLNTGILNVNAYTLKYSGTLNINTDGRLNLSAGSILNLNNSSSLNLNGGGEFYSIGTEGNPALVTADTGYYTFTSSVTTVSNLGASYTTFEKMGINGINLSSRCGLDPNHKFYRCTFQNGITGGTLLTINTNASHTIAGANFPANTWGGASNVSRTNSNVAYMITFSSWTGAFGGEDFDNDTYNRITWTQPAPPATPLNLQISKNAYQAVLTWNAVTGATGYYIYRTADLSDIENAVRVGTTSSTTWSDSYLYTHPRAFYYVTAYTE